MSNASIGSPFTPAFTIFIAGPTIEAAAINPGAKAAPTPVAVTAIAAAYNAT